MLNITINTLVNTLSQVAAQENRYLAIATNRNGYAIVDAEEKVVIQACHSIAALYDKIEERLYANMYILFNTN